MDSDYISTSNLQRTLIIISVLGLLLIGGLVAYCEVEQLIEEIDAHTPWGVLSAPDNDHNKKECHYSDQPHLVGSEVSANAVHNHHYADGSYETATNPSLFIASHSISTPAATGFEVDRNRVGTHQVLERLLGTEIRSDAGSEHRRSGWVTSVPQDHGARSAARDHGAINRGVEDVLLHALVRHASKKSASSSPILQQIIFLAGRDESDIHRLAGPDLHANVHHIGRLRHVVPDDHLAGRHCAGDGCGAPPTCTWAVAEPRNASEEHGREQKYGAKDETPDHFESCVDSGHAAPANWEKQTLLPSGAFVNRGIA